MGVSSFLIGYIEEAWPGEAAGESWGVAAIMKDSEGNQIVLSST
jgi:hypothetical protein